jgi:hypothetical protein
MWHAWREGTDAYKFWWGNLKEITLGRHRHRLYELELLRTVVGRLELDASNQEQWQVADCCEHGDEHAGFMRCGMS